jgi:cell division protein FtsB
MRLLAITLTGLLLLIQYPLWLGKGGLLRVWEMERQIEAQRESNDRLRARNSALDAEVSDLKQGLEAVEERARNELGMIRRDEVFFQVLEGVPGNGPATQPGK